MDRNTATITTTTTTTTTTTPGQEGEGTDAEIPEGQTHQTNRRDAVLALDPQALWDACFEILPRQRTQAQGRQDISLAAGDIVWEW